MFKKEINNNTIFILIIVIAIILRFINYFEIPFTHDEFSALFRLKFNSFSTLIEKGVKIDGHPAGVQVFLYFWTKFFGTQEWVVKFPFTIMGIVSVYLIYLIGKKWFNETVGLISASYIASIQFTVMYSQIARPYISGMFFSLLMIYYWSKLIMHSDKSFIKNSVLFIISASLCAYNHHFSLLFAAMVGVSGIFFIPKKFRIKYILSGAIIFILYIPHLKIFFYQLNVGGVEGWLGKPHNDFLIEFIYFIFNYSVFVITITLGIVLFGLLQLKKGVFNLKLIILSFVWFITPFFIGFFYSRYVNAVLQYSVLIFSFPFIFFVLFGFIKRQNEKVNLILVLVILLTNVLSLFYTRKHYDVFYKSIYKQILLDYDNIKTNNSHTIYIVDSHQGISDYYISELDIDKDFVYYSDTFQDIKEFKNFLEKEIKNNDKLFLGSLSSISPNIIPLIQDYFPYIQIQNNFFGGTTYLFSKHNGETNKNISYLDFTSVNSKYWSSIDTKRIISISDSTKNHFVYFMNNEIQWGPTFSCPLNEIILNKNNLIDISVKVKSNEDMEKVILVSSLESNGKNIYWGGSDFKQFILLQEDNADWIIVHHSINLSDIYLKYDDIILKIYIWNKSKRSFFINDFKITLREGNPIIYGLYERI
jgi:hypothetical protein